MTAAAYAASVRDARQTRILRVSDNHWIILNNGDCRTLRLPASAGVPDMTQCLGVSGFNVHQGQLYIHTMGNARTELVLTLFRQPGMDDATWTRDEDWVKKDLEKLRQQFRA